MNLTSHFTLEEMIRSETASRRRIDNTPKPEHLENLRRLCAMLERVRTTLGVPIWVTSGYRCPKLNKAIGGSATSAHMLGLAADFTASRFGSPLAICRRIMHSDLPYDQLILEYPDRPGCWVHFGIRIEDQRRENLTIFSGTDYIPGIHATPPPITRR